MSDALKKIEKAKEFLSLSPFASSEDILGAIAKYDGATPLQAKSFSEVYAFLAVVGREYDAAMAEKRAEAAVFEASSVSRLKALVETSVGRSL